MCACHFVFTSSTTSAECGEYNRLYIRRQEIKPGSWMPTNRQQWKDRKWEWKIRSDLRWSFQQSHRAALSTLQHKLWKPWRRPRHNSGSALHSWVRACPSFALYCQLWPFYFLWFSHVPPVCSAPLGWCFSQGKCHTGRPRFRHPIYCLYSTMVLLFTPLFTGFRVQVRCREIEDFLSRYSSYFKNTTVWSLLQKLLKLKDIFTQVSLK